MRNDYDHENDYDQHQEARHPMTIILAGAIGRSGLGGQAWAYLQYLIGFRTLGHEVY